MRSTLRLLILFSAVALCCGSFFGLQSWLARDGLRNAGFFQGIKVVWSDHREGRGPKGEKVVEGQAVNWFRLISYGPIVSEELFIYPEGALGKMGLRNIALLEDLTDGNGIVIGGMGWGRKTVLLDAYPNNVALRAKVVALHHEIFHTIDQWGYTRDKEWEVGSKYLGKQPVPEPWDGRSVIAGFIDNYSRSCPGEDKAEVYAYLMARYRALQILSAKDPVLDKKVRLMKARLATLDPRFDAAFWKKMDTRPLANSEWAWEKVGERLNLEPPHPPYEPVRQTDEPAGPQDPNASIERARREKDEFLPPAAPL